MQRQRARPCRINTRGDMHQPLLLLLLLLLLLGTRRGGRKGRQACLGQHHSWRPRFALYNTPHQTPLLLLLLLLLLWRQPTTLTGSSECGCCCLRFPPCLLLCEQATDGA
jgi:hypothetical protein